MLCMFDGDGKSEKDFIYLDYCFVCGPKGHLNWISYTLIIVLCVAPRVISIGGTIPPLHVVDDVGKGHRLNSNQVPRGYQIYYG
jgi:hypothetical protein